MTQRLERINVSAVNSSAPPLCEICGSIKHVTLNCQVGSSFSQVSSEVNYVQYFNSRPANDPYSSTYNPGWRNHPNFSYRCNLNPPNMPLMNSRPPLSFQRPPLPSQVLKSPI